MPAIDAQETESRPYDTGEIVSLVRILNEVRQSAFDRSLGVDDECFSSRGIVECVKRGLIDSKIDHLLSCTACQGNILSFTQTKPYSTADFVSQALRKAGVISESASITDVGEARKIPSVLLGLRGSVCCVEDPAADSFSFSCVLMPVVGSGMPKINPASLVLSGAIKSTEACVEEPMDIEPECATRFLRVTFKGVRIADRVKHGIVGHQAVIDTIHISGSFENEEFPQFSTKASIEFVGVKAQPSESAEHNSLTIQKQSEKSMSTFSAKLSTLLHPPVLPPRRFALLSASSAILAILVCFFAIPNLFDNRSKSAPAKVMISNDSSQPRADDQVKPTALRTPDINPSESVPVLVSHKRRRARGIPKSQETVWFLRTAPITAAAKDTGKSNNERAVPVAYEKHSTSAGDKAADKYVGDLDASSEKETQKAAFGKASIKSSAVFDDEHTKAKKGYRNSNRWP